jgi:hypothetical protein
VVPVFFVMILSLSARFGAKRPPVKPANGEAAAMGDPAPESPPQH